MSLKDLTKRAGKAAFGAVGLAVTRAAKSSDAPRHRFAPNADEKFAWLRNSDIRTVLDIGANVGQFAVQINSIIPSAAIYSFEPLPSSYEQLISATAEVPSFSAFPYALGAENGKVEMYNNDFSPSSSILRMGELHQRNFPFTGKAVRQTIDVRRLDDVVGNLDVRDNLLVKIDVQGFEDRVIQGGEKTIQRAKILIVETSFERLYEGQPLFDDIYNNLRGMGFVYHGAFEQLLSPLDGQPLQADSVFMSSRL